MNKKILMGVGLAASVFGAPGAFAVLEDRPYFNLWNTKDKYDGMFGAGEKVSLCGTKACGSDAYAHFSVIKEQPTGSGYIDPFLRFQHNKGLNTGSDTTEAAFNTNYRDGSQGTGLISGYADPDNVITDTNQAKDTKAGGDKRQFFNHAIRLGDLAVVDGLVTFKLDINETGNPGVTLRLDELAFFVAESDQMNEYVADGATGGLLKIANTNVTAQQVWSMDWNQISGGTTPKLMEDKNYPSNGPEPHYDETGYGGLNLSNINSAGGNAGSGDYDMQVSLSKSLFLNAANKIKKQDEFGNLVGIGDDAYVYLYNFAGRVGDTKKNEDGTEADAGFEEWAADLSTEPPDNGVPEPGTALLLFGGLAGMLKIQRQRKASQTSA